MDCGENGFYFQFVDYTHKHRIFNAHLILSIGDILRNNKNTKNIIPKRNTNEQIF